jgi:hypothetical protein
LATTSELAGCSNETRGLFGGSSAPNNVIQYITIASLGNATDFGDLTSSLRLLAACSSTTKGIFAGGLTAVNVIQEVTIATTGNATDFGDLTQGRNSLAGLSSNTIGVFGGGNTSTTGSPVRVNTIDYITMATAGNASDFGDLTVSRNTLAACSSTTRGVFGGGSTGSISNVMDYITIASTSNATDFGDLYAGRAQLAACSSAHGGL